MNETDTLLEVMNLKTYFYGENSVIPAVDDVSWSLQRSRTLALVGESGCGKTVSALSVMRLVPAPAGASSADRSSCTRTARSRIWRNCPNPRCAASAAAASP